MSSLREMTRLPEPSERLAQLAEDQSLAARSALPGVQEKHHPVQLAQLARSSLGSLGRPPGLPEEQARHPAEGQGWMVGPEWPAARQDLRQTGEPGPLPLQQRPPEVLPVRRVTEKQPAEKKLRLAQRK